jgi:hypothetical protein
MTTSLTIKDGNGSTKTLTVESSSYGYIPVHTMPVVTTVSQTSVTSFDWSTTASGTFQIVAASTTRKGLTIFNPGPANLYVVLSTSGGTKNGFTLVDTASAPTMYSFIVYPSGTFQADSTNAGVTYGGYFISGSNPTGVFAASIS